MNVGMVAGEALMHCVVDSFAAFEFLFHSFENQNVGVHGHTDGENKSGDAGSRKCHRNQFENS